MKSARTGTSKRRRRRMHATGTETDEGRDRWLVSYADLVTLLFALFVVLYAATDDGRARQVAYALAQQFGEAGEDATSAQATSGRGVLPGAETLAVEQSAINEILARDPARAARTRIARTSRGLVVSLAEAGNFASGESALRADAATLLDALADALRASRAPISIEGHTDSTPISNSLYPSNWELSAARAASVLARLTARGVASSRLSVAGYADERPIADNATPEGRALNRRVDLVILGGQ